MRRIALLLLLALPAVAAPVPCQPVVIMDGTKGTADFKTCADVAIDRKGGVTLTVGTTIYSGYVTESGYDTVIFELITPVRSASTSTARLDINGRPWTVSLRLGGNAPPQQQQTVVDPRTIEPANTNPANANPANAVQVAPTDDDIVALFRGPSSLIAVTAAGAQVAITAEGAAMMAAMRADLERGAPLRSATHDSAVGVDGTVVPGYGWPEHSLNALSSDTFFAVADGGYVHRILDPDVTWGPLQTGVTENLYGIFNLGLQRIWITGQSGLILTTTDGGVTWQRRDTAAPTLRAISFTEDGQTGYAVGNRGAVLRSDDGGGTWSHLTAAGVPGFPIPVPAPWYLLVNLLITVPALVFAARGRPNEDAIEQTESIADQLISDRALEAGEPDALNLRSIALGISRFMRNEKTVPPLTIAITGEWGSGKSSLMNLLKADLAEWRFRPVWFNAWHHQKEQHFLASLVQAIRRDASPPWWHVPFRLRLLRTRCKQHPLLVSGLLLAIAVLIGYERSHTEDHRIIDPLIHAVSDGRFWDFVVSLPDKLKDEFAFLVSVIGALTALWKGLQSFAAKPAALLASASAQPKLGDLDDEISFRGRFAPEFRDVTNALGDRPLVLFVDDLDRCQPDSVREMLEAINFLITSGNCFVILGIDRARVERYLNLSFGDAAQGEEHFASNYLDKLINIEVPVPAPNSKEALSILAPAEIAHEAPHPLLDRVRAGMAAAWALKPLAGAALVIWLGIAVGSSLHPAAPVITPPPAPSKIDTVPPTTTEFRLTPGRPPAIARYKTGETGTVLPGATRAFVFREWPLPLFLATIVGVGIWLFTRRPGVVVHDSEEFVAALEAWQPLLMNYNRTPRALKRFMNRVRYLAMRQRPQEEEPTMWRMLRAALTGKRMPPPLMPDASPIPEPVLVALAALSYRKSDEFAGTVTECKKRHEQLFGKLHTDQWEQQFRRMASDVRT
jgi:KAP family P-loop domain/Photosynthesis system II assembly factor YCF48